jgi:peroxin-2
VVVIMSSWQDVWENAQPSLDSLKQSFSSISEAKPRVLRVGQLDAESLDGELVQLLQDPLNRALAVVNVSFNIGCALCRCNLLHSRR